MSALRKWALGGLLGCVIGMIIFGFVLITGEMPGSDILGVIPIVVGLAGVFGIIVAIPNFKDPPNARSPP